MLAAIMFALCCILGSYALVFSGEISALSCFFCVVSLLVYIIAELLL